MPSHSEAEQGLALADMASIDDEAQPLLAP